MKRRIRRIRRALKRAGLYNAFHITLIAVLLTGFCVILFNVKEPEQQEKEPETIQAEVIQNPETMTQTAESIEDKYKVFDTIVKGTVKVHFKPISRDGKTRRWWEAKRTIENMHEVPPAKDQFGRKHKSIFIHAYMILEMEEQDR